MIDTRQPITRAEFRAPSARKRLTAGGLMLAGGVLLAGAVLPARADVESVTVRLEEARCFS